MPWDRNGGAIAPTTVNAGGLSLTSNINVTAQMNEQQVADAVRNSLNGQMPSVLDSFSRQLSSAVLH